MDKRKMADTLMNSVNVLIILLIVLLYVVTGTEVGGDAVAALSDNTVYRGKEQGAVALECVVSWNAAALPGILDTLRDQDVKITFFVSGTWARENAALLARMCADGHEIGSAGYASSIDGNVSLIRRDIDASVSVISEITGEPAYFYYGGRRNRSVSARAATAEGVTHVACTTDLLSGRGNAADIALRASANLFDGSILMIQPTAAAAEALPAVLAAAAEAGCRVTTVGALLK